MGPVWTIIPRDEIDNLSVERLPLLAPTTLKSGEFGPCSLRRSPVVPIRKPKIVDTPLEILDGLNSFRVRNDLA